MNEKDIVKESLLEIFRKNGYLDPSLMTQRHFEHIGDEIEKKSGILISGTTIRRLSNGEFSRLPQIATLNAIATYFNFKTWQEYKSSLKPKEKNVEEKIKTKASERHLKVPIQLRWGLLVVPVFIAGYYIYPKKSPFKNLDKATFSVHKNTNNDLPNTVVFNYNIDEVVADSFFIQQSWDKNRRKRIYKNTHTITDIYYEPGYHIAKLIANDSIIRTIDVHLPTDRWFFYAIDNIANYIPEYIHTDKYVNNGILGLSAQQVKENNIDITKDKLYHYTWFPVK